MIHPTADGVLVDLRVQPGAARSAIVGTYGDAIKVKVAAPPVDGRANDAVVELVAATLGVRRHQVTIISGESSRSKRVLVVGVGADEVAALLDPAGSHRSRPR